LTTALTTRHLDAFAAPDPATPDGFVAALLYPGVQMLVVSGRYPAPATLNQQIAAGHYKDVYSALQGNAVPDSKLFVQDMGLDGLRSSRDQIADIVYDKVVNQTVLSGDVGDSHYRQALGKFDPAYSHALKVLLDAVNARPTAPAGSVAAVH
jgi:methylmalonyl-CoA mutase cobalamin-binding subunit